MQPTGPESATTMPEELIGQLFDLITDRKDDSEAFAKLIKDFKNDIKANRNNFIYLLKFAYQEKRIAIFTVLVRHVAAVDDEKPNLEFINIKGLDPDGIDALGKSDTLLNLLAAKGEIDYVMPLIEIFDECQKKLAGAEPTIRFTDITEAALCCASTAGQLSVVEYLVNRWSTKPRTGASGKSTGAMSTASSAVDDGEYKLADSARVAVAKPEAVDKFFAVILTGDMVEIQSIVDANPNIVNAIDRESNTVLHKAVVYGDQISKLNILQYFLNHQAFKYDAIINKENAGFFLTPKGLVDLYDNEPLKQAYEQLFAAKESPNQVTSPATFHFAGASRPKKHPLHPKPDYDDMVEQFFSAIQGDDIDEIQEMITAYPDFDLVNSIDPENGNTVLHAAAEIIGNVKELTDEKNLFVYFLQHPLLKSATHDAKNNKGNGLIEHVNKIHNLKSQSNLREGIASWFLRYVGGGKLIQVDGVLSATSNTFTQRQSDRDPSAQILARRGIQLTPSSRQLGESDDNKIHIETKVDDSIANFEGYKNNLQEKCESVFAEKGDQDSIYKFYVALQNNRPEEALTLFCQPRIRQQIDTFEENWVKMIHRPPSYPLR